MAGHSAISYRESQISAGRPVVPVVRVARCGERRAHRKSPLLPDQVTFDRDRDPLQLVGVEPRGIHLCGREAATVEGGLPSQPSRRAAHGVVGEPTAGVRVGERAAGEGLDVVAGLTELRDGGQRVVHEPGQVGGIDAPAPDQLITIRSWRTPVSNTSCSLLWSLSGTAAGRPASQPPGPPSSPGCTDQKPPPADTANSTALSDPSA